jgi:hypothetical protein
MEGESGVTSKEKVLKKDTSLLREFDSGEDRNLLCLYYHLRDAAFDCFSAEEYNEQMLNYYSKGIEVKIVVPRKIKDSMYFLVCLSHTSDESCDTLCQLAFQCQRQFLGFSMLVKKRCFVCHKKTTLMCTQCKCACFCSRECQTKGWISHKKLCKKIKNSKIATEEEAETLNLLEEYE